jgi:hypothetical protein
MMKLGFRSPYNVLRMAKLHHLYIKLVEVPSTIHVEKYNHPSSIYKNHFNYTFIKCFMFALSLSYHN